MSLLIDVREVPWRILEAVQARILANRERMKRRAQAEKVKGLTRPRAQQKGIGATMSTYKRPEPLPLVLGDIDGVALAWAWGLGTDDGTVADVAIECASRESYKAFNISTASEEINSISWTYVMLPCGGNNAIVVVTSANVLPPWDTRSYTPVWEAVVVSRTDTRRITVPGAFRAAYESSFYTEQFNPAGAPDDFSYGFGVIAVTQYAFQANQFSRMPDGLDGLTGGLSTTSTPGWYGLLNSPNLGFNIYAEDDSASSAWAKRHFLSTAPTPSYQLSFCVREGSCPANRFDLDKFPYSPLSGTNVSPSLFVRSNIKPITFSTSGARPPGFDGEVNSAPLMSWDWGQPAYCKAQLLALGFSEEDLAP